MTEFAGPSAHTIVFRTKRAWIAFLLGGVILSLGGRAFAELSRLPGTVVPEHYQLKFTPDLAHDSFAGEETIDVQMSQPASAITLNAAEIDFQETAITSAGMTQKAQVSLGRQERDGDALRGKAPGHRPRADSHCFHAGH